MSSTQSASLCKSNKQLSSSVNSQSPIKEEHENNHFLRRLLFERLKGKPIFDKIRCFPQILFWSHRTIWNSVDLTVICNALLSYSFVQYEPYIDLALIVWSFPFHYVTSQVTVVNCTCPLLFPVNHVLNRFFSWSFILCVTRCSSVVSHFNWNRHRYQFIHCT